MNYKLLAFASTVFCVLLLTKNLAVDSSKEAVVPVQIVTVAQTQNKTTEPVTVKQIKPVDLETDRKVELYGEVSSQSVQKVIDKLKVMEKDVRKRHQPIYLLINSFGGSVFDGAQLVSQMEGMKTPVYTVCTMFCISMGAIIHQYGKQRLALDRSIIMFHPASGFGPAEQVNNSKSRADFIVGYVNRFNNYISKRSKMQDSDYKMFVAYELWVDAEEALNKGFVDGLVTLNEPVPLDQSATNNKHYKDLNVTM